MVRQHKKAYQTFTRHEKTKLAQSLVHQWQAQNPPGRFLEKDDTTGFWCSIGEKSARRKTSQLLREGAPKIRRQLKDESDIKKKRAATPLPALVPVAAAAKISQQPSSKTTRAVTPGAHTVTENELVPTFQYHSNNRSTSGNSNNASTPLKQITPAQANRSGTPQSTPYPYYYYPSSPHPSWQYYAPYASPVSVATSKPIFSTPPPTKKPVLQQEGSYGSAWSNQVTPDSHDVPSSFLRSDPSPESPLELELSTFQASWDFDGDILDNCGDIDSLVDEIEKEDDTSADVGRKPDEPSQSTPGNKASFPDPAMKVRLSPPRARLVRQFSPPRLSPPRTPATTANGEEQPMHLFDTWASFSFSSLDSVSAGPNSFDMDGIVSPDSHSIEGGLSSAVDILDELDQELEAEFLLS